MTEILAFDPARRTNAKAIRDAHLLGYLRDDDYVLDATWGLGRFWRMFVPKGLHSNDIDPARMTDYDYDYRQFPDEWADEFDVTVFDPPYKLNGTGGSHPSDEGYGVATPYREIAGMVEDIILGFNECLRVTKPGGYLLYKTQDQVVSGKKVWMSHTVLLQEARLRPHDPQVRLVDQLYVVGYRKQPEGRRQLHARSNVSVLQIYVKEK